MRALLVALVCVGAAGCASYAGTARDIAPATLDREPGWLQVRGVAFLPQVAESDCGAAAVDMVVSYWKDSRPGAVAATLRPAPARGLAAARLRDAARAHGLASFVIPGQLADLEHEIERGRPVLVGLVKPQRKGALTHYEVVVGLHRARRIVVTLDPAEGLRQNSYDGFLAEWQPAGRLAVIVASR